MNEIVSSAPISANSLTVMAAQLSRECDACTVAIDRSGRIIAANRRCFDLLNLASDDVLGARWCDIWLSSERRQAEKSVASVFAGSVSVHLGWMRSYRGGGGKEESSCWEVELRPLERDQGEITTALVTLRRAVDATTNPNWLLYSETDLATFKQAFHALGNAASVCASSARLLPRITKESGVAEICNGLTEASEKVRIAMEDLNVIFGVGSSER